MRNASLMGQMYGPLGDFNRYLPLRDGYQLVREGKAEIVSGERSGGVKFQMSPKPSAKDARKERPTITMTESEANAGLYGRSRTEPMTETQRRDREDRNQPAEDFIERAQAKVRNWAAIGDTLAPRVCPA